MSKDRVDEIHKGEKGKAEEKKNYQRYVGRGGCETTEGIIEKEGGRQWMGG